jgi:3-oxoacyl-[acyl-carrier protein] reductase
MAVVMESGLGGWVVWITGASGGIGRALATAFAAEGALLALQAGTRTKELERWVTEQSFRERAACFGGDVRDAAELARIATQIVERFGGIDVCVVNAGVWPEASLPLHEMDPERIRHVIDTNLSGALYTARAFMQELAEQGARSDGCGRSVCFIGSTAGRFGEAGHVEYAASKAALRGAVLTLKNELVRLDPRARANLVDPGWTLTEMAEGAISSGVAERAMATMALRKFARPEDVAHAVVFLSSPELAGHVSGETLALAGGMEGRLLWERP